MTPLETFAHAAPEAAAFAVSDRLCCDDGGANRIDACFRKLGHPRDVAPEAEANQLYCQQFGVERVPVGETPIELFLLQALAKEGLFPQSQMLIMDDGATFPSWYHLWGDIEFRHSRRLVTEADFFFETERIAVFCDGSNRARKKQREKDAAINKKLETLGIRAVRVPGTEINFDLSKAVARVAEIIKTAGKNGPQAGDAEAEAS